MSIMDEIANMILNEGHLDDIRKTEGAARLSFYKEADELSIKRFLELEPWEQEAVRDYLKNERAAELVEKFIEPNIEIGDLADSAAKTEHLSHYGGNGARVGNRLTLEDIENAMLTTAIEDTLTSE